MSVIIGLVIDGRIDGRAVYASIEEASEVLAPGTFFEETEETGVLSVGGFWDGEKYTPPTQDDIIEYRNIVNARDEEARKTQQEQEIN